MDVESGAGCIDSRGILRGACGACGCESYDGGSIRKKCVDCGHPPGRHKNLSKPISSPINTCESAIANDIILIQEQPLNCQYDLAVDAATSPSFDLYSQQILVPPEEQCILEGCNRPKYKDGMKIHDFCGKTHARIYHEQKIADNSGIVCKTKGCTNLRYAKEDGTFFDFCSLYCRDNQQKEGFAMLKPNELGLCKLVDCDRSRYQDPSNGRIHEYCSRSHAFLAKETGQLDANADEPTITNISDSPEAANISRKFTQNWAQAKGQCPKVCFTFSIHNPKLKQIWETYKSTLSDSMIEEYFHGTKLDCDLTRTNSLCTSDMCGICGIANIGFDRRCIRKNIDFQRFGHGFYLAPNSSKCHDYTQGKNNYRAMLLFDVCPGRKYQLQRDDETLTAPPQGYNSVHGKSGIRLNYDEIVLYNPDAALPKYVIFYQKDGEHKIAK